MDKQLAHKYQIWTADQNNQALPKTIGPVPDHPKRSNLRVSKPGRKTDELDTSMLLYSYGLPIALTLDGVATLPNGTSAKCQTTKISTGSVDVVYAPVPPGTTRPQRAIMPDGTAVSLNLEEVGALRGVLKSQYREGFQVAVDTAYQSVIGAKLSQIASKRGIIPSAPPMPSIPLETRIEPFHKDCWFFDQTNTLRKGTVVNVSQIDALLRASIIPPMGAKIIFRGPRRYEAEVTNIFKIGFMVTFCTQLSAQDFTTAIRFSDV